MTENGLCSPTMITHDPWSEGEATLNGTAVDTHFEDNFTQMKNEESNENENGLQLPESEHYLAVLGI